MSSSGGQGTDPTPFAGGDCGCGGVVLEFRMRIAIQYILGNRILLTPRAIPAAHTIVRNLLERVTLNSGGRDP